MNQLYYMLHAATSIYIKHSLIYVEVIVRHEQESRWYIGYLRLQPYTFKSS